MDLHGKKILITGGGSGIGRELARRLAAGNQVTIAGRDQAKLQRAQAETPALRTLRLDVTSEDDARSAIAWCSSELGGLDLLVNNAGVVSGAPLWSPQAATASVAEVQTNLIGSIRMTRLALPLLKAAPEGGVLFMSSAVALVAVPGLAVYAATKAALHSLARSLRAELKAQGIGVFEVLAPVVDTEFARALDVPKIPPSVVADAVLAGLAHNRGEIRVARVRQLALVARLAPRLADRVAARALRPAPSGRAD
jgi:uncharacterized oxidoreductase